ncbi:MAG: EAL domain-containing protein [Sterolibacterium sp.]|nr:EAL domain-containing protein [Sterolibacterium sp.]
MNPAKPPPPRDANEEIAALIETLHLTGQRLEELTSGEVDGVADRDGRTFLLRHAQEQLRHREAAKQAAILNALPAHIALLDIQGRILSVNEGWHSFASANALQGPEYGVGVNYLTICDSVQGDDVDEARQAAAGIRSVLAGEVSNFSLEYPCHSPTEQRWFLMTVTPLDYDHPNGVVVMHLNITERKQASDALRTSEREQRQLAEQLELERSRLVAAQQVAKIGSWETDLTTMAVIWSDQTHRIYETDPATFRPTHQGFIGFVHPEDRVRVDQAFGRSLDQRAACVIEHRVLLPDGRIKFMEERWQMIFDKQGKPLRAIGTCQDITERKAAADRILRLNRIYAVLSGINSLIVRTHDRQYLFEEACRIAVEQGGFRMAWIGLIDADGVTVTPVAKAGFEEGYLDNIQLSAIQDAPDGCQMIARALQENVEVLCNDIGTEPQMARWRNEALRRGYRSVAVLPLRVGEKVVGLLLLYAAEIDFFDKEEADLLIELTGDISFALDHIEKEKKLNYLAYYDVLTELPNRALFYDRLTQGVSLARRNQSLLAALFVDLDNFKTVNDTLGHIIGDTLLTQVSRRLSRCLRDTDTVGRLGGDEFGILLPEIGNSEAVAMVARKVIESCRQPYLIESHELNVSASIGIALFPDDAGDGEILIRNADIAMYRAKDLGRNTYQFFTAEMNQRTQDKLRLETDLRHALGKGEFLLHYQPKVSCVSGKITGFEALLRWQHPQRGMVGPNEFVPALEETGLLVPVGEWLLTTACLQAKRWSDEGMGALSMAVNISGRQIDAADFCETVQAALTASGLAPVNLDLELTESQLMKDAEGIIDLLKRLKKMGVNLSVDDFGTGYSSLAYLKRFPIDTLKVDRAFVRDIIADTNDVSITRAIITLAHNLKLKVVAEGVETEGQLGMLIANHCDEVQGYYFSRPLPVEEATALLRSGRSLDSRMLATMRQGKTLLLVDDEANILSALKRLLRHDGYDILTALGAEQGLEQLASHPVDVIVSDQRMPGMSGVEFLRRVKTLHPETVRLVLSGYTDLQAVTDAINEGAIYKFLTKPWDDDILRANIAEAFRHKEMADENHRMHTELALANSQMEAVNEQLQKLLASKAQAGDTQQG